MATKSTTWQQVFKKCIKVEEAFILVKNTGGRETVGMATHWHHLRTGSLVGSVGVSVIWNWVCSCQHCCFPWQCASVPRTYINSHWGLVGRTLDRSLERSHGSSPDLGSSICTKDSFLPLYPSFMWQRIQCVRQNPGFYCILCLADWFESGLKWNQGKELDFHYSHFYFLNLLCLCIVLCWGINEWRYDTVICGFLTAQQDPGVGNSSLAFPWNSSLCLHLPYAQASGSSHLFFLHVFTIENMHLLHIRCGSGIKGK